jgi:hypothetical protein
MPDQWHEIHGAHGPAATGFTKPVTRRETPTVRQPTCPEHCSGRHTADGVLRCPSCRTPAYQVVGHEWLYTEGHFWWGLEPMNGSPPTSQTSQTCQQCGRALERVWG